MNDGSVAVDAPSAASGVPVGLDTFAASAQSESSLAALPRGVDAVVTAVVETAAVDSIAHRLRDIGFVPGEPVRLIARGPLGAEPLLVQVGYTRFALRRSEAARVQVRRIGS